MLKQAKRHQDILEQLSQCGFASTEELVAQLDVSPQTIRRDLNELAEQGKVLRHHGGASLPSNSLELAPSVGPQAEMISRLARFIAQQIPDGASLFLSSGPLIEGVARALLDHRDLRIVTTNLNVASLLTARDDFQVYVSGGLVCNRDGQLQGASGYDFLRQFQMDYCLLQACALERHGQLLGCDEHSVRNEQAMIRQSRQVWVAVLPQAMTTRGMFHLADATQISQLYFAETPTRVWQQELAALNLRWQSCLV